MSAVEAPSMDKKKEGYDEYELDGFVRTLIEAEEIKSDPKKMAAIKGRLDKKAKAINSIAGLRKKGQEMGKDDY